MQLPDDGRFCGRNTNDERRNTQLGRWLMARKAVVREASFADSSLEIPFTRYVLLPFSRHASRDTCFAIRFTEYEIRCTRYERRIFIFCSSFPPSVR